MRSDSFCLDIKLNEDGDGSVILCKDFVEFCDVSKLTIEEIEYILIEAKRFSEYIKERKKAEKERSDIKDMIVC